LDAVISPPHLVKEALKAHFDKLFQDAGKLSSSTTTTSSIPSIFHPQGGQQISAPPTHRPSTSSTSSSISNPLSTPNQTVSPTSNETTSSRSVVPLGPSKAANDPPNQPQPGSTVSMSKAALQAISSKGTWKGWHYCGVVRWLQGTSDTEPLSDNEILEHSRKVVKKLRGSRGNGTAKGKKERKQTTRAEDYPNLRERWRAVGQRLDPNNDATTPISTPFGNLTAPSPHHRRVQLPNSGHLLLNPIDPLLTLTSNGPLHSSSIFGWIRRT
ncbi:hypothetical protein A4X13_0g9642, partial [Tilletia indica]